MRQFGWLLLAVSCAAGQGAPASVKGVKVGRTANGIQVDVSLSNSVEPSVLVTTGPDRLVVDFPNTVAEAKQQRIGVNADGVRMVRFGLHAAAPPVTRLVVDLDSAHPYELHRSGTQISLTVGQPAAAKASARRGPPPGARGAYLDVFHRGRPLRVPDADEGLKRPIPGMPPDSGSGNPSAASAATATVGTGNTASSTPATTATTVTATHASQGSLQQGTVIPGVAAPQTGVAPAVAGDATHPATPAAAGSPAAGPSNPPTQQVAEAPKTTPDAAAASSTSTVATDVSPAVPQKDSQPAPAPAPPNQSAPSSTQQQTIVADTGTPPPAPVPPATTASESASPAAESGDQSVPMQAASDPNLKTVFKVKFVADGVVYLDGGRSSGLAEGMKLEVKDTDLPVKQGIAVDPNDPRVAAELQVTAVAETSAVTDIHAPKRPVKEGDLAYLSDADTQALIQQRTLSPTREYPVVIAFTEGDPLDEEVRKEVPRPPQPSVNRTRGRIGFDYMGTVSHGTPSSTNSDVGMVLRADITRIGGSYWNLSGYWRGRLHQQTAGSQATLQDLINRTYHLGMFYDNPGSRWVVGVGRMYLPWAPSLDTIDGGYFGAKLGGGATLGIFGGSTPDPTSWSYNPDRRLGGWFINFEGGDYNRFHYTSTSGVGLSTLKWQIDRPFVFFENSLSYKRYFSVYDSLQADSPRANPAVPAPGAGISRNFLTVRMQVHPRVELDFNHNYLRDVPTYDPTLIGTGLLDKYLFQGFSVGARVEAIKQVFVYTNIGSSNRSGDAKSSLNELFGLTLAHLPWWKLRADAHYSRFNSSFADGQYRALSVGRNVTDTLRLEILFGDQSYTSALALSDRTRFVNANTEVSFGPSYFMQGGFTINRGQTQNYDQWLMTFGYRFDSKAKRW
ncbi:MAG TPA: AMIN domain-containing protein [Terracidiphilus sp.]